MNMTLHLLWILILVFNFWLVEIIFLETICNDESIIEQNIRLKVQQSPDYAEQPDFEAGYRDFKRRLENYEKVYEPVKEGSYIKMIDMVSGNGGQIQVNNISGYLPGRIVFFLVNTHLTPRPILLTRHGESLDNVRGRIGGDSTLSDAGELYAKKLANFVEKRLKSERAASVSIVHNRWISHCSFDYMLCKFEECKCILTVFFLLI
ncbi:hypothetical protein Cgig2_026656 [Carnegiea gigantea]|uniref:6-phosphofructo-2-kinase domain-containing protein n=1 Tax=Carnegiea gigantea TaxID=171969 RepID=A0A9Q1JVE0_9CARY|nr:hypothetical protein Cgig2_026656 [Carnegiea gigantea]